jgi:hypothetical protein
MSNKVMFSVSICHVVGRCMCLPQYKVRLEMASE